MNTVLICGAGGGLGGDAAAAAVKTLRPTKVLTREYARNPR